jgi:hypothetical protein
MTSDGKLEFICRLCSKKACPLVNDEDRRAVVECKSFTHEPLPKEPGPVVNTLFLLQYQLPTEIDREQDDVLNGFLVDINDGVQGYLEARAKKEQAEFQDDPA